MRFLVPLLVAALFLPATPADARAIADASAPVDLAVTVYRDPTRGQDEKMNCRWPKGFAMISETRTVTLPAGQSTIRFTGVAEGMVAVSAIVTGLPGGTIEKNRNADLLSPAALVDRSLGNRVTISRTNPATGVVQSESAIVRTRADGGLVLQTQQGFEAVRCSGLPEKLTFDAVPDGLSSDPVFSIDTQSARGGTYTITLTYLAWGFDWEASYVARLREGRADGSLAMDLLSWLTILNDNNQSFPDAELMAVAGTLNIESDFRELADEPEARPLRLTCYPFGSTAEGSPEYGYGWAGAPPPPPPPPPPLMAPVAMDAAAEITVTGAKMSAPAIVAAEEALGDLKLYRIPEPVTVSAQGQKQVAFLNRQSVIGKFVYRAECSQYESIEPDNFSPASMLLTTLNEKELGLGQSLPMGGITIYEPTEYGDLLVGETSLSDYALSQEVELDLPESTQVFAQCAVIDEVELEKERKWQKMRAQVTNANDVPVTMRFVLGPSGYVTTRGLRDVRTKDGQSIVEITVPANARRILNFRQKTE